MNIKMRIGGFHKQSFIDWEGKITAVIFTKGCNFQCRYCHNPELVYPKLMQQSKDLSENDILNYLWDRKNWLEGVVITGGEPTLQPNLREFIVKIKKMKYAVKLDTNGSSPEILESLIKQKLINYVAMDVKTIIKLKEYQEICCTKDSLITNKIEKSIKILKDSKIDYQLRTTVVPIFHKKECIDTLQKQFAYCNYRLQEYRKTKYFC